MARPAADDWRRGWHVRNLEGLRLTWKRFQAYSATWEHEHCAFCWKKFLDESYSPAMRDHLQRPESEDIAFGFTNLGRDDLPAGTYWICRACFDDFLEELEWTVEQSDPEAWPYDPPEPRPRPTAADFEAQKRDP